MNIPTQVMLFQHTLSMFFEDKNTSVYIQNVIHVLLGGTVLVNIFLNWPTLIFLIAMKCVDYVIIVADASVRGQHEPRNIIWKVVIVYSDYGKLLTMTLLLYELHILTNLMTGSWCLKRPLIFLSASCSIESIRIKPPKQTIHCSLINQD